jgi:hypothetical protein
MYSSANSIGDLIMQRKRHISYRGALLFTLACGLAALVLGVVLRPFLADNAAEASDPLAASEALPAPRIVVSSWNDEPSALVASEQNSQLTRTVNGLQISVSNARIEDHQVKLDVCYERPDDDNWLLRGATLEYNGAQVSGFSAEPIEFRGTPVDGKQKVTVFREGNPVEAWEDSGITQKGQRCDTLAFDVEPSPNAVDFTLAIQAVRMRPDEGKECDAYLNRVQLALNAQHPGIELKCTQEEWGANVTIASKPDSMSQEEAERIALSGDLFTINGPWVFAGTFK